MNRQDIDISVGFVSKPGTIATDEQVIIVDHANKVLGKADRSVMRAYKLPHRSTFVIVKNSSGKFYVSRRTKIKDYCPGMLEVGCGGVVSSGEEYEENAYREAEEELGIKEIQLEDLGEFFHEDSKSKTWGGLFGGIYDGDIVRQEEEVDAVYLMSEEEIFQRSNEFTCDGLKALGKYLELKKKT